MTFLFLVVIFRLDLRHLLVGVPTKKKKKKKIEMSKIEKDE